MFQHVTKACEGFDVTIEEYRPPQKPSKISAPDGRAYQIMRETMLKVFPSAIVSPFITIGGTDAVKYENLSDHIYRFSPVLLTEAEQRSIHNQNEYISIENYGRMILYFESIMSNYDLK